MEGQSKRITAVATTKRKTLAIPKDIWRFLMRRYISLRILGRLLQTCRTLKGTAKHLGDLFLQKALCYRLDHNDAPGREALRKAALCGNGRAMFYLGATHFYLRDWNFKFAGEVAQFWFGRSARAADPHGMIWYAYYLKTYALPSDKEEEQWEPWVQFALATNHPFVKGFCLDNGLSPSLRQEALSRRIVMEPDVSRVLENAGKYYEKGANELDDEFCWLRVSTLRAAQLGNRASRLHVTGYFANCCKTINFNHLRRCDARSKICFVCKEHAITCEKCNSKFCEKCYKSIWEHFCNK